MRELVGGERSNDFAGNAELLLDEEFLHFARIAQASRASHASITCSELGNVHRETSPANPRVMMSAPSKWSPMRGDLCARNFQIGRSSATPQNHNMPSTPPATTMDPSGESVA